ncbi:MAG: S1-like domain-containing RNA-binding protein [Clostridium sp.]|uniref:CvfB family protein n=1 Tax=Clostridium sp. TaxID=1506 RepID=UPI003217645A
MIELGKINKLEVIRSCEFGYYLDGKGQSTSEDILIPTRSIVGSIEIGDEIEAFIYKDSKDRLIATMKKVEAYVGDVAYLEVVDKSIIGAFVKIGIERDVFVPFKEAAYELEVGKSYLFYLYVDKTNRIAATTKVDQHLHDTSTYDIGQEVEGVVYGRHTNGNLVIALDNIFRGIILRNEYFNEIEMGEKIKVRVKQYFDDGKTEVTARKPRLEEMGELEEVIMNYLKKNQGAMSFNDKSNPMDIKKYFKASKNGFKRALGALMKKGLIEQDEAGTRLK